MAPQRKPVRQSAADTVKLIAVIVPIAGGALAYVSPVPVGVILWTLAVVAGVSIPPADAKVLLQNPKANKGYLFGRAFAKRLVAPGRHVLGFGDPGEADGHDRTPKPRTRLSAWWAIACGVGFAATDLVLAAFAPKHAAWTALISAGFGFLVAQAAAAAARTTATDAGASPAAMLERELAAEVTHANAPGLFATFIAAPVLAAAGAWFAILPTPAALGIAALAPIVAGAVWSQLYIKSALRDWKVALEEKAEWAQRWAAVPRVIPPEFVVSHDMGTHVVATFAIPTGADFASYEASADKLGPVLSNMVLIAPMPAIGDDNKPIPGATQNSGFTVSYSTTPLGLTPHLNGELDKHTLAFAIRWKFVNVFSGLSLGRPELAGVRVLGGGGGGTLLETQWKLDPAVTFDKVAAKETQIREKVEAPWLRVGRREGNAQPSEFVSIVYGDDPATVNLKRKDQSELRRWIDELEWAAWMRAVNIIGSAGTAPRLISKSKNKAGVYEMDFALPEGLALPDMRRSIPTLAATSGSQYLAMEPHEDARRFRVIAGEHDPLNDAYPIVAFNDMLFRPAQRGRPQIDWIVGMGADGDPITYEVYHGDAPHLLVAGTTGGGKSALINSLICQVAHNSTPEDVHFWLLDPKNVELSAYCDVAHVHRYVDGRTPGSGYENCAALLGEAREEMYRRQALFAGHPKRPQKLQEARLIAQQEGPKLDGSPHDLDLPFIYIIIDECADYFAVPAAKRDKEAHEHVITNIESLARLSRASGIILVIATQYPTNQNIPQTLKQQCRRVGLRTKDRYGSQAVIDQPGLEDISLPGRGLISWGKDYRGFRGFYMSRPDEKEPNLPDDRAAIIDRLPRADNERIFGAVGTSTSAAMPPPPAGIWDDEEAAV